MIRGSLENHGLEKILTRANYANRLLLQKETLNIKESIFDLVVKIIFSVWEVIDSKFRWNILIFMRACSCIIWNVNLRIILSSVHINLMKRHFGNNINNNYVLCKKTCFTKTVKVFLLKLAITRIEHVCLCVCIYMLKK
jgi:hypothetical protein